MTDEYPIVNSLELNLDKVVAWTDDNIKRVKWTDLEIDQKFASRSLSEIIEDGNTHYMNACLDLTLCSFELLKSLGYKNKFVVELLKHRDKEFNEVHFALESEDGTNKSFLDYSRLNIVYSGKGEYVNPRKDIDSLFKIKLDDSLFSRDDTYFDFFSRANLSELNKLLSDYSLVDHKRRLKRENTEENYEAYLAKLGDEPELKLSFL